MDKTDFTREKTYAPPLPRRLDGRKPAKTDIKTLLLLAALVVVVTLASYGAGLVMAPTPAPSLPTEYITNFFIDVNGDGLPDYIHRAEVIINPGVPLPAASLP